jgi:hypothetical protein
MRLFIFLTACTVPVMVPPEAALTIQVVDQHKRPLKGQLCIVEGGLDNPLYMFHSSPNRLVEDCKIFIDWRFPGKAASLELNIYPNTHLCRMVRVFDPQATPRNYTVVSECFVPDWPEVVRK